MPRLTHICCFILALILPCSVLAETEVALEESSEVTSPANESVTVITEPSLESTFFHAVSLLHQNKFGESSEKLRELSLEAKKVGYQNFPDFSLALLDIARTYSVSDKKNEINFLVRYAVDLSPDHAKTHFAASIFWQSLGVLESVRYFAKGVMLLPKTPFTVGAIIFDTLMLCLLAATLAMLLISITQLISHFRIVTYRLVKSLPRGYAGIIAPALLALTLIAPIFFGPLLSLIAIVLLLTFTVKSCRNLTLLLGFLVLAWGASLSFVDIVGYNVTHPVNLALENLKIKSYSPASVRIIKNAVNSKSDSPLMLFALAKVMFDEGNLTKATELWNKVILDSKDHSLVGVSQISLAAIDYDQGNYLGAKQWLEKAEKNLGESFFLLWNQAQVSLGLIDPAAHRQFYDAMLKNYGSELRNYEIESKTLKGIHLFSPQFGSYLHRFFILPWSDNPELRPVIIGKRQQIAQAFIKGGTTTSMILLGVSLVCVGGWFACSKRRFKAVTDSNGYLVREDSPSGMWAILPAGLDAAGTKPGRAIIFMTVFLTCLFVALEGPVSFLSIMPSELSPRMAMYGMCAMVMFGALVVSLMTSRQKAVRS